MNEKETVYIYHIVRKDGKSQILHPFASPEKLLHSIEHNEIEGRYGKDPKVEMLTIFRNELYRMIENGVRNWLSDKRFIPKFLISTGIFLLAFFFFSFVIRDPFPMIDEIAISLAAAVITYFLLGRKDIGSNVATKKRMTLRAAVDKIRFFESDFVKKVESVLFLNESGSISEVLTQITKPSHQILGGKDKKEASQFLKLLENRYNFNRFKKEEKLLSRYVRASGAKGSLLINKWIQSKNLDFPLYAVYKSFKQTVINSKK